MRKPLKTACCVAAPFGEHKTRYQALGMRDSIWSAPGYDEKEEAQWAARMEEARIKNNPSPVLSVPRTDYHLTQAFKAIPGDNWQEKLDHCLRCKCCMRHQTLKPERLVPWTETETENIIPWVHTNCECNCRHLARFICRQCDDDGNFLPCPTIKPITEEAM